MAEATSMAGSFGMLAKEMVNWATIAMPNLSKRTRLITVPSGLIFRNVARPASIKV